MLTPEAAARVFPVCLRSWKCWPGMPMPVTARDHSTKGLRLPRQIGLPLGLDPDELNRECLACLRVEIDVGPQPERLGTQHRDRGVASGKSLRDAQGNATEGRPAQSSGSTGRACLGWAGENRMPPWPLLFASYMAPSAARSSES